MVGGVDAEHRFTAGFSMSRAISTHTNLASATTVHVAASTSAQTVSQHRPFQRSVNCACIIQTLQPKRKDPAPTEKVEQ